MKLINAYEVDDARYVLYDLLSERTKDQSISHKKMPSFSEHVAFFNSKPYEAWYLIKDKDEWVGSVYLSKNREVGLFIYSADKGKGYGKAALEGLVSLHGLPLYANINPKNAASIDFFGKFGFEHIQNTYLLTET